MIHGPLDPSDLTWKQLPTIIKSLGFAKDANEVQLWSVIPYAVAAVVTGSCDLPIFYLIL